MIKDEIISAWEVFLKVGEKSLIKKKAKIKKRIKAGKDKTEN